MNRRSRIRPSLSVEKLESRLPLAGNNLTLVAGSSTSPNDIDLMPTQMTDVQGTLYFIGRSADQQTNGLPAEGLWSSDGTQGGTRLVKQVATTANTFDMVTQLTGAGSRMFFAVAPTGWSTSHVEHELWVSDGSAAGTTMLKSFNKDTVVFPANARDPRFCVRYLTAFGADSVFCVEVSYTNAVGAIESQSQLWKSNGTTIGTRRMATFEDVFAGTHDTFLESSDFLGLSPFFTTGDRLYFTSRDRDQAGVSFDSLVAFDGTSLTPLLTFRTLDNVGYSGVRSFTNLGGNIYFGLGTGLWQTDGTPGGTRRITQSASGLVKLLTTVGDRVYYAQDLAPGSRISSSDGTVAGTRTELELTTNGTVAAIEAIGTTVVCFHKSTTSADQAWAVDTPTGNATLLAQATELIPAVGVPRNAVNTRTLSGRLFFTATDATHGTELWESDGTPAGTRLYDIWTNAVSSDPDDLIAYQGNLYFSASAEFSRGLWRLSPPGTVGQQPVVTIASSATALGPNETATITFTLSESSADFTVADVTVSGGELTNFAGSGTAYSATFVPTPNITATGTLSVAADAFTNAQGVGNAVSGSLSISIDTVIPSIGLAGTQVLEGNAGTTFVDVVVSLSAASTRPVSVNYATADGSALVSGGDYTAATGTLVFAVGETQKAIRIAVNGDTTVERDETFTVQLSNVVNANSSNLTGTVTIRNDDVPPSVFVNDIQVTEGTGGTTTATFTIQLSVAQSVGVTVRYTTLERTAKPQDGDYRTVAGTLVIPAGRTSATVPVTVTADSKYEADEKFAFRIVSATGVTITRPIAHCTIHDDDAVPVPRVSVSDVRLTEGQSAQKMFSFVVSLSEPTSVTVSVAYQTVDGTATAGLDYVGRTGTLQFYPGTTRRSISIWVRGDTAYEPTEQFSLELVSATGATLDRAIATGTILNDDKSVTARRGTAAMFAALVTEESLVKTTARERRWGTSG